ncbi:MAG TPA: hypothetical protein HA279_08065 [Candidatus Poseidoniaceae archaeon]|nr:hypothetical protein [Candidatus Poseidoniaceae archaeon]
MRSKGFVHIAVFLTTLMLLSTLPVHNQTDSLREASSPSYVPANLQSYKLYLDSPNETVNGDGMITTKEPSGSHEEASAVGGLDFRSAEMFNDLWIYGQGSSNDQIELKIYLKFEGPDGSTADLTMVLESDNEEISSETLELDDPCESGGLIGQGGDCSWTPSEVFFSISSDGFKVEKGSQIKLSIDASVTCQTGGQGGIGGGGDGCELTIAYGDVEQTPGTSHLELKANALSDSSVKVHQPGMLWTDPEVTEWEPYQWAENRDIEFTVDVRSAFGRDDIQRVELDLTKPSGTNSASSDFPKLFEDDDLRLDNNGLVGNFTWTYPEGIAPGQYNLTLQVTDVQGHVLTYNHMGIQFVNHGIDLSLPVGTSDTLLYAPGQVSSVDFQIRHTGAQGNPVNVVMEVPPNTFPSSWSDPIWDKPQGYELSDGGEFAKPILTIETPEADLSDAPELLEVFARAYAENENGLSVEVAVERILLDMEEVGVYSKPRVSVYEDEAHQKQIADSERPEAFDSSLSHYIDSKDKGVYFMDIFNAGFDTDTFRILMKEIPLGWQYEVFDNTTGAILDKESQYYVTPSIASHEILTMKLEVYPPSSRDDADIGLLNVEILSTGDSERKAEVFFTVHRTFGILAEVFADSDGGDLGTIGPISPTDTATFDIRITDSTDEIGERRWLIVNPSRLDENTDLNPAYASWNFEITDSNGSNAIVATLGANQTFEIEMTVQINGQIEAGNHTIYLRVKEEVVDDSEELRYFDLPLIIKIEEIVTPNNIVLQQKTSTSAFLPSQTKSIEYLVKNNNNIPLDIVITASAPSGWDVKMKTSNVQLGANFVILTVPAFSQDEFTMDFTSPDSMRTGEELTVEFEVTPMDEEVPYPLEFKQEERFKFATTCDGFVNCVSSQVLNPSTPTIGLYFGLGLVLFIAIYRKGAQSASGTAVWEEELEEIDSEEEEKSLDIPPPIEAEDDFDDDLELIEELDDL